MNDELGRLTCRTGVGRLRESVMKKIIVTVVVALIALIGTNAYAFPPIGSEHEVFYLDGGAKDTIFFYAYFDNVGVNGWDQSPWKNSTNWNKTSKDMIVFADDLPAPVLEYKEGIQCEKNASGMYIMCQAQMKNYFNGENGAWAAYSKADVAIRFQIGDDYKKIYYSAHISLTDAVSVNASDLNDDEEVDVGTDDTSADADEADAVAGSDTDGDKIDDSKDNCPALYNPSQVDHDGDGIGDYCDNCMFVANPDQADGDNDNFGDACILDSDGDGVKDKDDNCPTVANPDQANGDRDFYGDACERTSAPASVSGETTPDVMPLYDEGCSLVAGAEAGSGAFLTVLLWAATLAAISRQRVKK